MRIIGNLGYECEFEFEFEFEINLRVQVIEGWTESSLQKINFNNQLFTKTKIKLIDENIFNMSLNFIKRCYSYHNLIKIVFYSIFYNNPKTPIYLFYYVCRGENRT